MDTVPFELWAFGGTCLYLCGNNISNVIQLRHEPSIWKLLNWSTKYIIYGTNQWLLKKYEVNFTNNSNDTLQSAVSWFSSKKLCWWLFVTQKPQRTKGHPKHDLAILHLPHLWLRWNFFEKIGNIFLQYLVALSSCNTRFREEKWELSQLEYSGEMQLLQKHFDMEKHTWMLIEQTKNTQNIRKHSNHQCWSRMYHFWEISII